jgi:hypothetical protein
MRSNSRTLYTTYLRRKKSERTKRQRTSFDPLDSGHLNGCTDNYGDTTVGSVAISEDFHPYDAEGRL